GVRNRGPWRSIFTHSLHQFHENDLFTSAAAMSYFGLMTLFPALLLMLALSNKIAVANELINRAVDVYPGSRTFLHGRALTIGMIGIIGLLLALSVVVTSFVVALRDMANSVSPRQIARY